MCRLSSQHCDTQIRKREGVSTLPVRLQNRRCCDNDWGAELAVCVGSAGGGEHGEVALRARVDAGEVDGHRHVPARGTIAGGVVHSGLEHPGTTVLVLTSNPVQGPSGCSRSDRASGRESSPREELDQIPGGGEQVLGDLGGEID